MDFLKKARRKAEAAMKEVQDNLEKRTQQSEVPAQQQQYHQQPYGQGHFSGNQIPPQYQQPQTSYPIPSQAPRYIPAARQQTKKQYIELAQPVLQSFPSQPQYQPSIASPSTQNPANASRLPILEKCLAKESAFTRYTQFYTLTISETEVSAICSNCFNSFGAANSSLAPQFTTWHSQNKNEKFECDFASPAARYLFQNHCMLGNTVQPRIEFTRLMLSDKFAPCGGEKIPGPGQIYMTRGDAVAGLVCCERCFEIMLRGTPFQNYFEIRNFSSEKSCGCDVFLPSYKRMLVTELEKPNPDFRLFAQQANARINAPECTGPGISVATKQGERSAVFTAVGGKSGNICTACYYDHLINTLLADSFVFAYLSDDQLGTVHCDLASAHSKLAMDIATKRGNDDIWRDYIRMADVVGPCVRLKGVDEAELIGEERTAGSIADWYHVTQFPAIEVCPHCYHLQAKLLCAAHLFSPITRPLIPNMIRMCFFNKSSTLDDISTEDISAFENTLAWRSRKLMNTIDFGYESGDWTDFPAVSQELSLLPPPCGGQARGFLKGSRRQFLGHIYADPNDPDDCTIVICQECHYRFILNTPLAPIFSQDLTKETWENKRPTGYECLLYSPRLKSTLRDGAKRGDLVGFTTYWNNRKVIGKRRQVWKPILEEQKRKQDASNRIQGLNAMVAINAQANALMMHGGASFAEAAMTDTGVRYGNSTVGMGHLSANGGNAAMAMRNAMSTPNTTSSGNMTLDSKIFLERFAEDERAWLEVE